MAEKKKLFTEKINKPLIAQYVRVYRANQRKGTASAKTRGEVSGGGKKPWRQKGTGRARHGSIRSPIWVGGGVSHGPKPRDWGLKMPKKMRRIALLSALSYMESEKRLHILESPKLSKISTKKVASFLETSKIKSSTLLVLPDFKSKPHKNIYLSSRNLKGVNLKRASDLNAYEVMRAKNIVFLDKAENVLT